MSRKAFTVFPMPLLFIAGIFIFGGPAGFAQDLPFAGQAFKNDAFGLMGSLSLDGLNSPSFLLPLSEGTPTPSRLAAGGYSYAHEDGVYLFLLLFPPTNLLGLHFLHVIIDKGPGTPVANLNCCLWSTLIFSVAYAPAVVAAIYILAGGESLTEGNKITAVCIGLAATYLLNIAFGLAN